MSDDLVRRIACELVGMLQTVVTDAGYVDREAVCLMVHATGAVLAAMLQEDGAVAAAAVNATLKSSDCAWRLVATN